MVDPQAMRATLRYWASGVSVVTTAVGDRLAGMTVSAFNSLSLDPPMILVCLSKDSHTAQFVMDTKKFGVSFLGDHQAHLSDRFAGRIASIDHENRFTGVPIHTAVTGAPILSEAVGWMDCEVSQAYDGATHWIVTGRVLAAGQTQAEPSPLVYFDRHYRTLSTLE